MIIDSQRQTCTFRSATTDPDYRLGRNGILPEPWRLDRSMQEASTAMMRQFLEVLRNS
jgi:hypothetical protein